MVYSAAYHFDSKYFQGTDMTPYEQVKREGKHEI